jgi:hypothetical protein
MVSAVAAIAFKHVSGFAKPKGAAMRALPENLVVVARTEAGRAIQSIEAARDQALSALRSGDFGLIEGAQ